MLLPFERGPRGSGPALVLLLAFAPACTSEVSVAPTAPPPPAEARSSLPRDRAPVVSAADRAALERGNLAFAFDLYRALRSSDQDLFVSPYSVASALAMTYVGAAGGTAAELRKTLHLELPVVRASAAFDALDLELSSRAHAAPPSGQPFALQVVNAFWGERTETWRAPFLDTLAADFGAGVELADFAADPSGTAEAIDAWAKEATAGRIAQLVPASAIGPETRLVVANAVLFQASWATPFATSQTHVESFTGPGGVAAQVAMMHRTARMAYAAGTGWQMVELPYAGGQVAMDVLVPAAGGEEALDAALTGDGFAAMASALSTQTVALSLPQIRIAGATRSLAAPLGALGMPSAFDSAADFSGMCADAVRLGDVLHQASLSVDESGSLATAATAGIGPTALGTPVTVEADHPFVVVLRDLPTGTVLFVGKIVRPV